MPIETRKASARPRSGLLLVAGLALCGSACSLCSNSVHGNAEVLESATFFVAGRCPGGDPDLLVCRDVELERFLRELVPGIRTVDSIRDSNLWITYGEAHFITFRCYGAPSAGAWIFPSPGESIWASSEVIRSNTRSQVWWLDAFDATTGETRFGAQLGCRPRSRPATFDQLGNIIRKSLDESRDLAVRATS